MEGSWGKVPPPRPPAATHARAVSVVQISSSSLIQVIPPPSLPVLESGIWSYKDHFHSSLSSAPSIDPIDNIVVDNTVYLTPSSPETHAPSAVAHHLLPGSPCCCCSCLYACMLSHFIHV